MSDSGQYPSHDEADSASGGRALAVAGSVGAQMAVGVPRTRGGRVRASAVKEIEYRMSTQV